MRVKLVTVVVGEDEQGKRLAWRLSPEMPVNGTRVIFVSSTWSRKRDMKEMTDEILKKYGIPDREIKELL